MTSQENTAVTLEQIRKQALPIHTKIVAGNGQLHQVVNWVMIYYPELPLEQRTPNPGDLVLVANTGTQQFTQAEELTAIRKAEENKAVGLIFQKAISHSAITEANAYGIPVLIVPASHSIRQIERVIISLLVDRNNQLDRRGMQIYRELTEISARNEGINALIGAIARLTGKTTLIQDKYLRLMESEIQPNLYTIWDEIESYLKTMNSLPTDMQDRHRVKDITNPVMMQGLPVPGYARLVAPIVTKEIGRGYLSIIGAEDDLDEIDFLIAEHGALACALEMAKQKAISETEKRLRGTFLDRLLNGDVSQSEAIRQGERLNHNMNLPHIAIALRWLGEKTPSVRRLETIVNKVVETEQARALVWQREREGQVIVFHATDKHDPIDTSIALANKFVEAVRSQFPNIKIAIGLGQAALEIGNWRNSHRDAEQALELAGRLQTDTPLYIADLGVYQLILGLSDQERLIEFCNKSLGRIIDYDLRQHADLLQTLEAFFYCHGNLSQTAERLIVHRNTLLYRMNRINQIADIDLDRPETRLALHLALTIRRLLNLN
ncbi:MAG UNVERIFIED_CONTAM: helix-turn-helix domain-containing protein [Anaerolineae bacterium]|jgi:purine catabolism regulator